MSPPIHQQARFRNVTPAELYRLYLDPGEHARALGAPVSMSPEPGGRFTAFGEAHVRGVNLLLVPDTMVVQTWRARVWHEDDPDSVLILRFVPAPRGAAIELTQAGVPDHARDIIEQGWALNYWQPWTAYLEARRRAR